MSTVRIFQRPKNATQSGKYRTDRWQLEFTSNDAKRADPLTGWAGGAETREQVRLGFPTLEAATAYAEREGLSYTVITAPEKQLKLQSYADNFR
ncbi:ETC complex I subunit [Sphingomonas radiodurans]|uniref:ETC complex I subunit n=1 Tax=Sphingomonas radiodurans TaxID=2890321 RepID=UPI001E48F245|nr:ETC complex I subunit [Sphingomonas radiodurans]WBH17327.1 ETC complex I subunit [Sphingomonas radiodurans]